MYQTPLKDVTNITKRKKGKNDYDIEHGYVTGDDEMYVLDVVEFRSFDDCENVVENIDDELIKFKAKKYRRYSRF
ncbi:hypothetical protein COBT_003935 [Conglomerata obtusa]